MIAHANLGKGDSMLGDSALAAIHCVRSLRLQAWSWELLHSSILPFAAPPPGLVMLRRGLPFLVTKSLVRINKTTHLAFLCARMGSFCLLLLVPSWASFLLGPQ
jgi:hypothetical protein